MNNNYTEGTKVWVRVNWTMTVAVAIEAQMRGLTKLPATIVGSSPNGSMLVRYDDDWAVALTYTGNARGINSISKMHLELR